MPKLPKLFWLLTIISTFLICSSTFAQVLDSRNGEEEVESKAAVESLDVQQIPSRKYVELSIKGPLAEVRPTFVFSTQTKTLRSITKQIDKIRKDDEVAASY